MEKPQDKAEAMVFPQINGISACKDVKGEEEATTIPGN